MVFLETKAIHNGNCSVTEYKINDNENVKNDNHLFKKRILKVKINCNDRVFSKCEYNSRFFRKYDFCFTYGITYE